MVRECPVIDLPINYKLIGEAVEYYQSVGYTLIEVDWMVDPECSYATWGREGSQYRTQSSKGYAKHLVGSAEQGFIQAVKDCKVNWNQKYVSVSPCFRRGDIGPINNEWFMKVELSEVTISNEFTYKTMLKDAMECFERLGAEGHRLHIWKDMDCHNEDIVHEYDCEERFIELGSYGCRNLEFKARELQMDKVLIHYGTGLALPRFQLILP